MLNSGKEEISIYFSGHNIRTFAVLAVESFLLHYPELRDRVYYFDDESTDGSGEELLLRGVNVISWDPALSSQFNRQSADKWFREGTESVIIRCDYIFKSILKHCTTRYIFIQDGDTVTIKGGFLESYLESGLPVCTSSSESRCGPLDAPELYKSNRHYSRYRAMVFMRDGISRFPRIHPYHLFIDTSRIGDTQWIFDNLADYDYITLNNGRMMDVGSDFYAHIIDNGIPYARYSLNETVYHWGWLSSLMRDRLKDCSNSSADKYGQVLAEFIHNESLMSTIRRCSVSPTELLQHLQENIRRSAY